MIWTGFKVNAADRDRYFKSSWRTVFIELPAATSPFTVEVNVAKKSFWGPEYRELIRRDIGRWMLEVGHAPWPHRVPPRLEIEPAGERRFRIK